MELRAGTLLQGGKYKIIQKIGQGGFGIVYKAHHQSLQCTVCIKEFFYADLCERSKTSSKISIISTSADKIKLVELLRQKFTKEAQRLAQFQNPHIIHVMDNFEENSTAYFVMEYIDGGSLQEHIFRKGAASEETAKKIMLPIIDALQEVHKKGLLHLDIKPANILLKKGNLPVLIDFGISKYMEVANVNNTTAPIGVSKGYAPLEQYGGTARDLSKATDVYSICATLYKLVTSVTPPEPLHIVSGGIKSPREYNPQLSLQFIKTIKSGLSVKASERPQNMSELRRQLSDWENADGGATTRTSPTFIVPEPKKTISSWFVVFLIGIAIIIFSYFYELNKNRAFASPNYSSTASVTDSIAVDTTVVVDFPSEAGSDNTGKTIPSEVVTSSANSDIPTPAAITPIYSSTVTDIDGNVYKTVKIGTQIWMAENLKVSHYRNGDEIPEVTSNGKWFGLSIGALCNYENDAAKESQYGKLYNWYAVKDKRKIAPKGWHVASVEEWTTLTDYLGGEIVAGGKLKEAGTAHWKNPNAGIENSVGFGGRPGGFRNFVGAFYVIGSYGYWWSSTTYDKGYAWYRNMNYGHGNVSSNILMKSNGLSVRCVRDAD